MIIAVAYDEGNIGEHFGHAKCFALYNYFGEDTGSVEKKLVDCSDKHGHADMAQLMKDNSVDAVLVGNMGAEAKALLLSYGIVPVVGYQGDADTAADLLVSGQLPIVEGGTCGGGCGGCRPSITGPNVGRTVKTHYRGTFNDGTQFDSSYDRGEPLEFVCGAGMMIPGYDRAVADMEVGQSIDVHLMPDEAYGEYDPNAVMEFEIAVLKGSEELNVGDQVYLTDPMGRPVLVTVIAKDDTTITLDANDQMAGKELNFHIELVEVR